MTKKICQVSGCGGEASALLELRRVYGAVVFSRAYLCELHAEKIDDAITDWGEPD